jgi:type IV secretory pathway VirB10-like protein
MRKSLYVGLLAGAAMLMYSTAFAQENSILDDPTIRQLEDQDVDANKELLDALIRSAKKGPIFRISPERVVMDMVAGARGSASVRITNAGDDEGHISGVNVLGSIPGMEIDSSCDEVLIQGDYCEVTLTFESDTQRIVNTSVIGTTNQKNRSSFEVPVSISVRPKPAPVEPKPEPVIVRPDPEPRGPLPRDVAREYMRVYSPMGRSISSKRGFTIVSSKKDPLKSTEVAGVQYGDIKVESVLHDERFAESIPHTEASLPVDRSKILTTDRVIKAVLETPVSNVMCNKVVAMVESDVYSATSSTPLIQAGSRVVGECQDFADERVGIAWTRIITTDGRSISFEDRLADTADATAIGGVPGRIYKSPFDRYVLPIFSTMIDTAAGVIFAKFGDDETVVTDEFGKTLTERSARNEGLRIVTEEARGTSKEIIADIRDVREVAVIPKGSRIDIEIQEDIYFRQDRKVVTLADMRFDLDDIRVGEAERSLPEGLVLIPVAHSYKGATVEVNGRRYRVQADSVSAASEEVSDGIPEISRRTIRDLSGAAE